MDVNYQLSSQHGGATGRHQAVASSLARSPSTGIDANTVLWATTRFRVPADPHIKAIELDLDRSFRQLQWGASSSAVVSRAGSGSDAVSATQHVQTSPTDTERSSIEENVLAGLTKSHWLSQQQNLVGNAAGTTLAAPGDMDSRGPLVGCSAVDKQDYPEPCSAAPPVYYVHGRSVGNSRSGAGFGAPYVPTVVPANIKSSAAHRGSPWELLLQSWIASQSAMQQRLSRYSMQGSCIDHSDFQLSAARKKGDGSSPGQPPSMASNTSNAEGSALLASANASTPPSWLHQHAIHVGGGNQRDFAGMRSVPKMSGVAGGPLFSPGPGSRSRQRSAGKQRSVDASAAAMRQGCADQRDALPQKRQRPVDFSAAIGSRKPPLDLHARVARTPNTQHPKNVGGRQSREQLLAAETLALGLSQDMSWQAAASAGIGSASLHQRQGHGVDENSSFGRGYLHSLDQRVLPDDYPSQGVDPIKGRAAWGISPSASRGPPPMTAREQSWAEMKQQEWMRQRHPLASHWEKGSERMQLAHLTHGQWQWQQQQQQQWQQQWQQQQLHQWQQQQQQQQHQQRRRQQLWLMQRMQSGGLMGPASGAEQPVRVDRPLGTSGSAGRPGVRHASHSGGQSHHSGGQSHHQHHTIREGLGRSAAAGGPLWSPAPAFGSTAPGAHRSASASGSDAGEGGHTVQTPSYPVRGAVDGAVGAGTERPSSGSAATGLPGGIQARSVGEFQGSRPLRGARKAAQSGVRARRMQERSGLAEGEGEGAEIGLGCDRDGSGASSGKEHGFNSGDSAQPKQYRGVERGIGVEASWDRVNGAGGGANEFESRLGAVEAAGAVGLMQSSKVSSSSSSRSSSSSSGASASSSSAGAGIPQPASWPRGSTKSKWFSIVMNSTRGGADRASVRREKQAIIRRLFDDFEFAAQCSLELLRRGAGGTVKVADPSDQPESLAKMASTRRSAVRLVRGFNYSDMEEWTESMTHGCWEVRAEDQPAVPQLNQAKASREASSEEPGTLPFVPPDPAGRQVRGYQLYIVFRPVGATTRRPKQYRTPVQRGVSVAKLLRGGTERRTSICAKLRSVTSPDPNGNEAVLQWVDELLDYKVI